MKTTNVEAKVLKGSILFLMISALLMTTILFTSCSDSSESLTDDVALIEAIETSSARTSINTNDLPSAAQSDLETDFSNDAVYDVTKAEGLGFEVRLVTTEGSWTSELNRAFFDVNGRQLEDRRRPRHGRRRSCFKIVFPFSVTMPDNSVITLENRADKALIRTWYAEHPDVTEKPELIFPIEIEYQDGTVATINSQNELETARQECRTVRCFDLVYPFTVTMPDDTTITLNSEDDRVLIRAWYADNPGVHERPTLVYPIEIVFQDGSTQTIHNSEEYQAAKDSCQ
jgi:hypothetical protein